MTEFQPRQAASRTIVFNHFVKLAFIEFLFYADIVPGSLHFLIQSPWQFNQIGTIFPS